MKKCFFRLCAIVLCVHLLCGTQVRAYTPVIDAGHGGEDGGAVSLTGVAEAGINLAIAEKTDALFAFYGVPAVMLRREDVSLHDPGAQTIREKKVSDLHNRVTAVQSIGDAVLISVHQNNFTSSKYQGAQVFYAPQNPASEPLAERTQELLRCCLDPTNERACAAVSDSIYLMNHVSCPAILVECGFLSNGEEERKLRSDRYQTQIAAVLTGAYLTWAFEQAGEEA